MDGGDGMRILLSAYGFSPFRGSEGAVGWNIAKELAKYHDVTVITGEVKDRGYENEYPDYVKEHGPVERLTVVYLRPTRVIQFIEKLHDLPGLWALYYLAYNLWQRMAFRKAKELHRQRPFDAVHHLTMIGYREPGYMWKLGIPFFWGPVGGSVNEPLAYSGIYSISGRIKAIIRYAINGIQKRVLLRPRIAARRATKIWAVTSADADTVTRIWGAHCEQMVETAATVISDAKIRSWDGVSPLRIVWSGTHTYGKALPILIYALVALGKKARLAAQRISIDVLGQGEETEKWKHLAENVGVGGFFNWIGYVPRCEALNIMDKAHMLVFTSVKEGTPHVVFEALSLGLPVVCHDACGMGYVVDERCGFKVQMTGVSASIDGFASAIERVTDNPELVEKFSGGALQRAKELTWAAKAKVFADAYNAI